MARLGRGQRNPVIFFAGTTTLVAHSGSVQSRAGCTSRATGTAGTGVTGSARSTTGARPRVTGTHALSLGSRGTAGARSQTQGTQGGAVPALSSTLTWESTQVYFVPAVANLAAPTLAELAAGTNLTPYTPVAGIQIQTEQQRKSLRLSGDPFTVERMGGWGASASVTFVRHSTSAGDVAWNTFSYLETGYLVVVLEGTGVPRRCEVYPVECGQKHMQPSAENELKQFSVDFAVTSTPELDAVVT